jgi:Flp pilus assembly pilin Flp
MNLMIAILKKFWMAEDGGESVEWPLVVALVIIGLVATWALLGDAITDVLNAIIGELENAV